ncbi:MAG: N-acetyltransferase [Bacteroidia bacterium]
MTIRPFSINDAKKLLEIYSYYVLETTVSFEYQVPSSNSFNNRCLEISKNYPFYVLEIEGEIKGYAYANRFRGRKAYDFTVEISVYLQKEAKNRGLGSKLYHKLFKELTKEGFKEVIAVITLPNTESFHFHEKNGFQYAGKLLRAGFKFEKWWDIAFFQKSL